MLKTYTFVFTGLEPMEYKNSYR